MIDCEPNQSGKYIYCEIYLFCDLIIFVLNLIFFIVGCPGSNSSGPLERNASSVEYETNQDESDIQYVNNIEEWLALRVQGGSKTWKLPFCLNPPPAE